MRNLVLRASLSAFLLWIAWPPFSYTAPILLLAFVPLLSAVDEIMQKDYQKKGKKIFLISGLTFLIWNTASIYWVFNAMHAIMPTIAALLISLIPFGLAAALMAFAFWLYYRVRRRLGSGLAGIALICFWLSYEYLHQTWSLAFPWMTLGNGFANSHPLIQWYEYTGVYGGSLWIWASNLLLFHAIKDRKSALAWKKTASFWLVCVLAPISISLTQYYTYEEQVNPADIIVVQPNVDPYEKYTSMSTREQVNNLIRLSDSLAQPNTEFFIWPETAIPEYTDEEGIRQSPAFHEVQQFLFPYKNASLLSGMETYLIYDSAATPTARPVERAGFVDSFNAAVLFENSGTVQFYHKSKLVPGVEQMPFRRVLDFLKPLFAKLGGTTGGYGSQSEPSVFYAQSGIGVAPIICFESIWGAYVGQFIQKGAQFIAVITNDAWWGNTAGKDQHLQYAKLRAIETRRWVARSANTGISAFINQRGDIVQQSAWWVPTALNQEINLNEEITFYVKTGDYLALAAVLGTFLLLGWATWKRSRLK